MNITGVKYGVEFIMKEDMHNANSVFNDGKFIRED